MKDGLSGSDHNAQIPTTPLALAIGDAKTFAAVTRNHILGAGEALGLARATAQRELVRLLKALPVELEKLCTEVESGMERAIAASPDPVATRNYIGVNFKCCASFVKSLFPKRPDNWPDT